MIKRKLIIKNGELLYSNKYYMVRDEKVDINNEDKNLNNVVGEYLEGLK